jgi:hypothetical protein
MTRPRDIAAAAARELQVPFIGKSHRYVVSDELKIAEIVKILGAAIAKPELPWIQFSDEDTFSEMTAAEMYPAIAGTYLEMGKAIDSGILFEDYQSHKPLVFGDTKLTGFANEFAAVYYWQQ